MTVQNFDRFQDKLNYPDYPDHGQCNHEYNHQHQQHNFTCNLLPHSSCMWHSWYWSAKEKINIKIKIVIVINIVNVIIIVIFGHT